MVVSARGLTFMVFDISLAASIAEKVLLAVVGVVAARWFERRPRLAVFYGHVGTFRLPSTPQTPNGVVINTHTVVIRNSGKLAAHNVRVPHRGALEAAGIYVSVDQGVNYDRNTLPGGEVEIVFPLLVPRQQVTLSYLYFAPITFNVINMPVTSDEGLAKVLNVLPTPQFPKWVIAILWVLIVVGVRRAALRSARTVSLGSARDVWFGRPRAGSGPA